MLLALKSAAVNCITGPVLVAPNWPALIVIVSPTTKLEPGSVIVIVTSVADVTVALIAKVPGVALVVVKVGV